MEQAQVVTLHFGAIDEATSRLAFDSRLRFRIDVPPWWAVWRHPVAVMSEPAEAVEAAVAALHRINDEAEAEMQW